MVNSILVLTTVHNPEDARIRFRQITTLLESGWRVTYAAPFSAYGLSPKEQTRPGLNVIDMPRALGRRRARSLFAAHRLLKERAAEFDLVLLHDPELLISYIGTGATNTVLDMHEDPAAAIDAKQWIPKLVRAPIFATVRAFERWAERRMPLLLAEYEYQERFTSVHPVIPNAVRVPATAPTWGRDRVVYLGALTLERGARELVEVAERLQEEGEDVTVEIIGPAHGTAEQLVAAAHAKGLVTWHGFVPSERALSMLDGALVGLSLLHDMPNYRHSMPTKILEYMAHGVPVVSTPLPVARNLVDAAGCGVIVPFNDTAAVVEQIRALRSEPALGRRYSENGYETAREKYDWNRLGEEFERTLAGYVK